MVVHFRIALFLAVALLAGACGAGESDDFLYAFESAEISADGSTIAIDAFEAFDPDCIEYDRIETELDDGELIVSLYYRDTGQEFCTIPCPLGTERLVIDLPERLDPTLTPIQHPDTAEHCSQLSLIHISEPTRPY